MRHAIIWGPIECNTSQTTMTAVMGAESHLSRGTNAPVSRFVLFVSWQAFKEKLPSLKATLEKRPMGTCRRSSRFSLMADGAYDIREPYCKFWLIEGPFARLDNNGFIFRCP